MDTLTTVRVPVRRKRAIDTRTSYRRNPSRHCTGTVPYTCRNQLARVNPRGSRVALGTQAPEGRGKRRGRNIDLCKGQLSDPARPSVRMKLPWAGGLTASPLLFATQREFKDVIAFERNGHVCTRALLSADEIASVASTVRAAAKAAEAEALTHSMMMHDERAEDPPFLQSFNLHRHCRNVLHLVSSPRLAGTAAALLGAPRVRLYQDSFFLKRAGDGPTRWHTDLGTAPIDCNDMVTVWLPLRPVLSPDEGGTSLLFAEKSHRDLGRLWYDHDSEGRYDEVHHGALAAGDATWHHGWILHSAAPNDTDQDREALAVTYIADGARALTPEAWGEVEDEDSPSYRAWIDEVDPGTPLDHALLPVVFDIDV